MELDAQVEEPLQASGTEQKHKHKKKDKHKHKHHKKSKRDRHAAPEQNPATQGLQVEGEVARTGSEDGELPGPRVVEALTAAPSALEVPDAKGPADSIPAGPEHTNEASADRSLAKRRYARNAEYCLCFCFVSSGANPPFASPFMQTWVSPVVTPRRRPRQ